MLFSRAKTTTIRRKYIFYHFFLLKNLEIYSRPVAASTVILDGILTINFVCCIQKYFHLILVPVDMFMNIQRILENKPFGKASFSRLRPKWQLVPLYAYCISLDFLGEKNYKNVFPPDCGSLSPAKQHTQIYQSLPSGKASFSF